jgi:hypothetical protein
VDRGFASPWQGAGRALYQSLAVDAEFRARWQEPFDTVMRGLMIALQGKYAALMQRVDQLAAMPDRGAAVTSFVKEVPGALPLLWHFFNQLQTPAWLPHLARHRYRIIVVRSLRRGDRMAVTCVAARWQSGAIGIFAARRGRRHAALRRLPCRGRDASQRELRVVGGGLRRSDQLADGVLGNAQPLRVARLLIPWLFSISMLRRRFPEIRRRPRRHPSSRPSAAIPSSP